MQSSCLPVDMLRRSVVLSGDIVNVDISDSNLYRESLDSLDVSMAISAAAARESLYGKGHIVLSRAEMAAFKAEVAAQRRQGLRRG